MDFSYCVFVVVSYPKHAPRVLEMKNSYQLSYYSLPNSILI